MSVRVEVASRSLTELASNKIFIVQKEVLRNSIDDPRGNALVVAIYSRNTMSLPPAV